jgi:hypothetical protein
MDVENLLILIGKDRFASSTNVVIGVSAIGINDGGDRMGLLPCRTATGESLKSNFPAYRFSRSGESSSVAAQT